MTTISTRSPLPSLFFDRGATVARVYPGALQVIGMVVRPGPLSLPYRHAEELVRLPNVGTPCINQVAAESETGPADIVTTVGVLVADCFLNSAKPSGKLGRSGRI
jgi:hypothetical protein